jgi:YD repeat-containing protein
MEESWREAVLKETCYWETVWQRPKGDVAGKRQDTVRLMDRWTNITWRTGAGGVIRQFGYSHNAAGMITNVVREDGGHTAYDYDGLDRLTAEMVYDTNNTLTAERHWGYDLAGNRTNAVENGVTNTYTLGEGDRLASWGTNAENTVKYDAAGNVTNMVIGDGRTLSLAWNLRNQITEAATNGVAVERYGYDAFGRRVFLSARLPSGSWETNWFVYDGPHVVADVDSTGGLVRTYIYGPGVDNILAMTVHTGASPVTCYYVLRFT